MVIFCVLNAVHDKKVHCISFFQKQVGKIIKIRQN